MKHAVQDRERFTQLNYESSLYGLRQSGLMWYNRPSEYLLKDGYVNNVIC